MDESSSDGSADEDEMIRNFDEETKLIVQTETLPKKSADRYLLVYNTYKKWQEENKNSLSNSDENNLIIHFSMLKEKLKPPTLWSIWSMLRKTLSVNDNVDIDKFLNLKILIKSNATGYKPKKSLTLNWSQIMDFMTTAPDHVYLAKKIILVFGVCGALRCDEISNMMFKDVEDLGNKFLVSIQQNKNDYHGQFVIGNLFYNKVKQYILLRPTDQFSDRFFIHYLNGKCTRQNIGRHKVGEVPENIASYLNLENTKKYTGHCFRRTAATLLSESGANMQMIKQLGRWRSDIIAQGYIENSMRNREMIYNGITHGTTTSHNYSKPSTSKEVTTAQEKDESNYNLNWADFSEDFPSNNLDPNPGGIIKSGFETASNRKIHTPITNNNDALSVTRNSKLFVSMPPVKLNFNHQVTAEPPSCKKRKSADSNHQDENQNDISSPVKLKFEFSLSDIQFSESITCKVKVY